MAGAYVHTPQGPEFLAAELRKLKAQVAALQRALTGIGLQVDPDTSSLIVPNGRSIRLAGGDMVLDGGDLVSANFVHGVSGSKVDGVTGTPEFNDLILRGGIIGNDALSSPVSPKTAHSSASSFSLTTTAVAKASATITVPSGFSQALVLATMSATAVNSTGSQDFFDGYADINAGGAPGGFDAAADGAPGFAVGIAHTATALLTSLGGSFTVRAMLRSGAASWSSNSFNSCNIDALVLFLR